VKTRPASAAGEGLHVAEPLPEGGRRGRRGGATQAELCGWAQPRRL